jgi:hypothetical protein
MSIEKEPIVRSDTDHNLPLHRWVAELMRAWACLSLLLLTSHVSAQDKQNDNANSYRLALAPTFKVRDRWRTKQLANIEIERVTTPEGGEPTSVKNKMQVELVAVCKAKAVDERGMWKELELTIEKLEVNSTGKAQPVVKAGEVLQLKHEAGKTECRLSDGKPLAPERQRLLQMALGKPSSEEGSFEDAFELSRPRKTGEEWIPTKENLIALGKSFAKDLKGENVSGAGHFKGLTGKGKNAVLNWNAKINFMTENPPVAVEGGVPVKGSFEVLFEVSHPADQKHGDWTKKVSSDLRQAFKGKPGTKDAETLYEGKSLQVFDGKIEFLESESKK